MRFPALNKASKRKGRKSERVRAGTTFRHISTTLPSGLSPRYQSFWIHLQICPLLQQISAERLSPSGRDIVSIEDESSPGTGFSIVAGRLGLFTQLFDRRWMRVVVVSCVFVISSRFRGCRFSIAQQCRVKKDSFAHPLA